jgi:hypothetical protein
VGDSKNAAIPFDGGDGQKLAQLSTNCPPVISRLTSLRLAS